MGPGWKTLLGAGLLAPGFLLLTLVPRATLGDEPRGLGRFFRFGQGASSSASGPAVAPSSFGSGVGTNPTTPPQPITNPIGQPPSDAAPASPASPTGSGVAPRILPQPRVSRGFTEADPMVSRIALARSNDGNQFGMFLEVFADGTVIDGEGVHHVSPADLKPLVEALQASDLYRLKGHCGAPATDFVEQVHVIVFERNLGRLRASSFSFSGNTQGCDHAVRHLQSTLDALQAKLDAHHPRHRTRTGRWRRDLADARRQLTTVAMSQEGTRARRVPGPLRARSSSAAEFPAGRGPRSSDRIASRSSGRTDCLKAPPREVTMRRLLARHPFPSTFLTLLLICWTRSGSAQGLDYVRSNYTKYEYKIPMRDGKRLFTSVYVPKETSKRYPLLLTRTPYSVQPYGIDRDRPDLGPSPLFGKAGYIFVYQDVRGRWMSEGEFVNMRPEHVEKSGPGAIDESTDTFDTIDWLVKNVPNHNGKVGQWGISYPGFYTVAGLIGAHPALQAASPQAPVTDWFMGDDWHHNGAFFLPHAFNFLANFGRPRPQPTKNFKYLFEHGTPDGYQFFLDLGPLAQADEKYFKGDVAFWNELMTHGNYDAFWKARNIRAHLKDIRPAVMTVGGWFDAENLFGALEVYRKIEATSPKATNVLVMGPWLHGGWSRGDGERLGHVPFDSKTAEFYREKIELPFFEKHLKGVGDEPTPEAWVFETGRNQWRRHEAWPPKGTAPRSLYLRKEGGLSFEAPDGPSNPPFDEYLSDPARPIPFLGTVAIGMAPEYMVEDQRFAARRPDVLVYQTGPLDADVTLAGPIKAELTVSTSGTDSDWIVKLIDVYPDDFPDPEPNPAGIKMGGFQQLVRGDVMRGKFRNSFEAPEPFRPDQPTPVEFPLQDVYHTFRPGHRIMVQIQSTWFPLVDRNPQTFTDIYHARESDFHKATQRVYRDGLHASRLQVLVLP